jgi:hypothetical protein
MTTELTYGELIDRLHAIKALRNTAERRMLRCVPGSDRGYELAQLVQRLDADASTAYNACRNHPDAPPQG